MTSPSAALRFHIVDVFAERPYAGNQLAVVVGLDALSDETMQEIAAEVTVFKWTRAGDDGCGKPTDLGSVVVTAADRVISRR